VVKQWKIENGFLFHGDEMVVEGEKGAAERLLAEVERLEDALWAIGTWCSYPDGAMSKAEVLQKFVIDVVDGGLDPKA